MTIDAVVTHHTDRFRSGVARFNELLARHLDLPLLTLEDDLASLRCPLYSFKASELGPAETKRVYDAITPPAARWEVFLHEYAGAKLEQGLVRRAERVLCGSRAIGAAVSSLNRNALDLWTPSLLVDDRSFPQTGISVFSFGMAHKIRTDMFGRLRQLLAESAAEYTVFVSAANHETSSMRDAETVFAEMHEIFRDRLFFLGNLADVAVVDQLRRATFFAAFFDPAVRDNNTTVASAMEMGSCVITNLDELSPSIYVHGMNVIDIEQCDRLPRAETVEAIGRRAAATAEGRGWDALIARLARGGADDRRR